MSLWVKLCGIRSVGDLEAAIESGADAVGVVMTPSIRQVSLGAAFDLVSAAAGEVTTVAVFYRPDPGYVAQVRDAVPFDLFQAEPSGLDGVEGIGVLPVAHDGPDLPAEASQAFGVPGAGRVLVESSGRGGRGVAPDWGRVAGLSRLQDVVIAGGLDPWNVSDAVEAVAPGGVDVSSGVESSPGVKDPGLMRAFVAAARSATREATE